MRPFRTILIVMAIGCAVPMHAQDGRGWTFSGRFQGSSNSSGLVMKADPTVGYSLSHALQTYAGLPVYFVNESSTTQTSNGFVNGIGNAYVGLHFRVDRPAVNYASTLEASAPTGDKDKGFSTGHATVDWTNRFSHEFESVMPFASVGVANTVSDTSFFARPFSSLGLVSHFDAGAQFTLAPRVGVGASAYGVRASGEQRIFSKIKKSGTATSATGGQTNDSRANRAFETRSETVGSADLANDHGFSTWLAVHRGSSVDLQVGYSRSVGYDLNSLFFGVGFRVGK